MTTLALLSGGGQLPVMLAAAAKSSGWPVHVVAFSGQPQPDDFVTPVASHATFNIASVGKILAHLKAHKITHVVMGGNLNKPSLFQLRPDVKGLKLLASFRHYHDDHLLRGITDFLVAEGFEVLPVTDLLPGLKAPAGVLGKFKPSAEDEADIGLGLTALRTLGELDIGQAVVVYKGAVIGVEAVEGTDALMARCAGLRGELAKQEKGGWLVKAAKPNQTKMADLPTVGPRTLELLAHYHYKGVAVQADTTLLIDQPKLITMADAAGVSVVGINSET